MGVPNAPWRGWNELAQRRFPVFEGDYFEIWVGCRDAAKEGGVGPGPAATPHEMLQAALETMKCWGDPSLKSKVKFRAFTVTYARRRSEDHLTHEDAINSLQLEILIPLSGATTRGNDCSQTPMSKSNIQFGGRMMAIEVVCQCGKRFRAKDEYAGRQGSVLRVGTSSSSKLQPRCWSSLNPPRQAFRCHSKQSLDGGEIQ